jgi:hypothetical protein
MTINIGVEAVLRLYTINLKGCNVGIIDVKGF